jgi:hypothetical protein
MAGEPKQLNKSLTSSLSNILEAAESEHISINHIRVVTGNNAAVVNVKVYDASVLAAFSLFNNYPIKANSFADIYVQALEPGDRLQASADVSGTNIIIQYDSTASTGGGGGGGYCPVSNQPYALAMNGYVTSNYDKTDSTDRYEFATDLCQGWIALGTTRQSGTGFGSEQNAYTVTGNIDGTANANIDNYNAPSRKYNYVTLLVSDTSALGANRLFTSSFYNKENGYIVGGGNGNYGSREGTNDARKWSYATDTVLLLSSTLSRTRTRGAAASNLTVGVYIGGAVSNTGEKTSTSEKLTFATDTWSAGASLSQAIDFLNGFSNSETAIFAGGYVNLAHQYSFINNTTVSIANLPNDVGLAAATSSTIVGLIMGGEPLSGDIHRFVSKFEWVTQTWSAGTNLSIDRGYPNGSASTTPGHFG